MLSITKIQPKKYDLITVTYEIPKNLEDICRDLTAFLMGYGTHVLMDFGVSLLGACGTSLAREINNLAPIYDNELFMKKLFTYYFKYYNIKTFSELDLINFVNKLAIIYVLSITPQENLACLPANVKLLGVGLYEGVMVINTFNGFLNLAHIEAFIEISGVLLKGVDLKNIQLLAIKEITRKNHLCPLKADQLRPSRTELKRFSEKETPKNILFLTENPTYLKIVKYPTCEICKENKLRVIYDY